MAVALGQVIEWSPPRTIGIAPVLATSRTLRIDDRVAAVDPGRDDVGVAGVDDGQDLERLDVELERVDRAGRVLRLADGARAEPGTRPVGHRVVERRADDRDVDLATAQLGRVGDPRQLHERGRPDVGRQVEIVVGLELAIPAVLAREVTVQVGVGWALSHGVPPGTVAACRRGVQIRLARGAAGSKPVVQRDAPRTMVAHPQPEPSPSGPFVELPPGGREQIGVREQLVA